MHFRLLGKLVRICQTRGRECRYNMIVGKLSTRISGCFVTSAAHKQPQQKGGNTRARTCTTDSRLIGIQIATTGEEHHCSEASTVVNLNGLPLSMETAALPKGGRCRDGKLRKPAAHQNSALLNKLHL